MQISRSFRAPTKATPLKRAFATQKLDVKSPATGETLKRLDQDSSETIQQKLQKAQIAQREWSNTSYSFRRECLERFGTLLATHMEDGAKTLTSETGKPIAQARNEIKGVQGRLKFFLETVESAIATRTCRSTDTIREEVRHEPLGVIANISAWNYPYFVGSNVFIPALLTGNSVLYKPSEYSSLTGLFIANLLHEAGVPKYAFQTIIGDGTVGGELLNQQINGVFFTGSFGTGQKIAQHVGSRMIRTQLELGGKDPTYVCDDTDVEFAAKSLADGAFYNTGQSCCSVERIYVHTSLYERFLDIFIAEVKGFKMGDPFDEQTYIGPLTMSKQIEVLERHAKDAVSKGAKLHLGGKRLDKKGNWFEPTVLTRVNHSMAVMKEESFGPIIGIQEVKNDEEAVGLMNDTVYGLTSGVYTPSRQRAEKILSRINSGTVYWNACDRVSPFLPWSGRNGSGIGATLGLEGIYAFVQPKSWHLITK